MSEGKKLSDLTLKEHAVGIIGIGVIIAVFTLAFIFFDEDNVWDRRLKSGYHYMDASDDLGRSEWSHADENGSKVVVWKVEASENTSESWIVVGFGTNSIMYSYDIVYDQDHVDRIIKEKY